MKMCFLAACLVALVNWVIEPVALHLKAGLKAGREHKQSSNENRIKSILT